MQLYPAKIQKLIAVPLLAVLLLCVFQSSASAGDRSFTLAVIPDTQNYIDFRHQKAEGFELDGSAMFIRQMQYVAEHGVGNGGDIAFVAAVGDVWQHQTILIDDGHKSRGFGIEPDPILARRSKRTEQVLGVELPTAVEGYRIISDAGLPFGVAPGNHDYDAAWSVAGYPPNRSKKFSELERTVEDFGILHVGGLDNFRSVFGDDSDFFRDRPWYVASYKGGANSAQKFFAGGYHFLHLALEMQPGNDVLRWAELVIARHPGLPTIVTTHDYLNVDGERQAYPLIDLARVDPDFHNSAEQLWQKLISQHDQVFMVLSGHHHGQSYRVDRNVKGNPVHQVLADYQGRGQAAVDAGRTRRTGLGDGWLRLMHFDFSDQSEQITVKTFSSHYNRYSSDMNQYADWYKAREKPHLSDSEFYSVDDFVIRLEGFSERFPRAHER
jgi:hypothetical protein